MISTGRSLISTGRFVITLVCLSFRPVDFPFRPVDLSYLPVEKGKIQFSRSPQSYYSSVNGEIEEQSIITSFLRPKIMKNYFSVFSVCSVGSIFTAGKPETSVYREIEEQASLYPTSLIPLLLDDSGFFPAFDPKFQFDNNYFR